MSFYYYNTVYGESDYDRYSVVRKNRNTSEDIDYTQPVNWNSQLNKGLLGWWKVLPQWSGGNKLIDLCGINHGTLVNGPEWSSKSHSDSLSILYSGSQYTSISKAIVTTAPLTFSFWFNPTDLSTNGTLVSISDGDSNWWRVLVAPGYNIIVDVNQSGAGFGNLASNIELIVNNWYFVCGSFSSLGMTVYINGNYITSNSHNASSVSGVNLTQIGVLRNNTEYAKAYIDDVRVYNRALARIEVKSLYDSSLSGYQNELNYSSTRIASTGRNVSGEANLSSSSTLTAIATTTNTAFGVVRKSRYQDIDYTQPVNWNSELNKGLISWWKVLPQWKGGNKLIDLCGRNHDTLINIDISTAWTSTPYCNALKFDGIDDYSVGSDSGLPSGSAARTMCAWFKTSKTGSAYQFIASYGSPGTGFKTSQMLVFGDIDANGGFTNSFGVTTWGTGVSSNVNNADGNWHLGCATFDGSTWKIYVDGLFKDSKAMTTDTILNGSKYIGVIDVTYEGYFDGLINDIRIYNRALSSAEVKSLYHASLSGHKNELNYTSTRLVSTGRNLSGAANLTSSSTLTATPTTTNTAFGVVRKPRYQDIDYTQPVNWDHPLNKGLISWWKVLPQWKGGSKWMDLSGKTNGVLTNMDATTAWNPEGYNAPYNDNSFGCLNFDGANDYVEIPIVFSLATFSIAFWVKQASVGGSDYGAWVTTDLSYNQAFFVGRDDPDGGNAQFWVGSGRSEFIVNFDEWSHIVCVYGADTLPNSLSTYQVWVNGTNKINTVAGSGSPSGFSSIRLGNSVDNLAAKCKLDDLRIYSRVLSAVDIKSLYNSSLSGYKEELNYTSTRIASTGRNVSGEANLSSSSTLTAIATTTNTAFGVVRKNRGVDYTQPVNWNSQLNNGLVGWWKVLPQWSGGNVLRDLCRRHDGLMSDFGSNAWQQSSHLDGFGSLFYNNSFVDVGNSADYNFGTGEFTLSAWVKTSSSSTQVVMGKYADGKDYWLGMISGAATISISGYPNYIAGSNVADNRWHLITGTRKNGVLIIYVDGQALNGLASSGDLDINASLTIGKFNNQGFHFYGSIDDVRVYKRGLNESEVKSLYNSSLDSYKEELNYTSTRLASTAASEGEDVFGDADLSSICTLSSLASVEKECEADLSSECLLTASLASLSDNDASALCQSTVVAVASVSKQFNCNVTCNSTLSASGGSSITRTISLSGIATTTQSASVLRNGTTSAVCAVVIAGSGNVERTTTSNLSSISTLSASGGNAITRTINLSSISTTTQSASVLRNGVTSAVCAAFIAGSGNVERTTTSGLSSHATLSSNSNVLRTFSSTVSSISTLASVGSVGKNLISSMACMSSISCAGIVSKAANSVLSSMSIITSAAAVAIKTTSGVVSNCVATLISSVLKRGDTNFTCASSYSGTASVQKRTTSQIVSLTTLISTPSRKRNANSSITANLSVVSTATRIFSGTKELSSISTLTGIGGNLQFAGSDLSSISFISALGGKKLVAELVITNIATVRIYEFVKIVCTDLKIGDIVYLNNRKLRIREIRLGSKETTYVLSNNRRVTRDQITLEPVNLNPDTVGNKIEQLENLPIETPPEPIIYECPINSNDTDLNRLRNAINEKLKRLEDL